MMAFLCDADAQTEEGKAAFGYSITCHAWTANHTTKGSGRTQGKAGYRAN